MASIWHLSDSPSLSSLDVNLGMDVEVSPLSILAITALVLMLSITGGVLYLTAVEWRDRRRQEREKRGR